MGWYLTGGTIVLWYDPTLCRYAIHQQSELTNLICPLELMRFHALQLNRPGGISVPCNGLRDTMGSTRKVET